MRYDFVSQSARTIFFEYVRNLSLIDHPLHTGYQIIVHRGPYDVPDPGPYLLDRPRIDAFLRALGVLVTNDVHVSYQYELVSSLSHERAHINRWVFTKGSQ